MERIFRDQMAELYWLAYLLTGDRERSVQAYTGALNSEAPAPGAPEVYVFLGAEAGDCRGFRHHSPPAARWDAAPGRPPGTNSRG